MTILNCRNVFCIYWANHKCMLKNVVLDARGCCPDYTPLPLDKETLAHIRSYPRTRPVRYIDFIE